MSRTAGVDAFNLLLYRVVGRGFGFSFAFSGGGRGFLAGGRGGESSLERTNSGEARRFKDFGGTADSVERAARCRRHSGERDIEEVTHLV